MDVFEITGWQTGRSESGVNFLEPADSFRNIENGFIYRQVLQSRKGFKRFVLNSTGSRIMGIFEHVLPDNSTQLLVITKELLYRYNPATIALDPIPFGGSLAAMTSFGIVSNHEYVSGTTYPFANGNQRFVFTGRGMSGVYMYDGTQVLSYTNVVDNPNYQAFATGNINKANHVVWFGERLNFFAPTINSQFYAQGVLYSAIRDSAGNGDKYNSPGAGLLQADTFEYMTGVKICGDQIIMNFFRSNWALEKTRDAFNPYFVRKIPSVLGTDSTFSAVFYADHVESLGRTGVITTDTRESTRTDNKIPFFTKDNIDPDDIELTYGGFDRDNSQFLFAYRDNESSIASTQDKVLVHNYEENSWSVYDQRFSVFGQSYLGFSLTWDEIDETINPAWAQWDTTEEIWDEIGVETETEKTLAGDNLGFLYELNQDYDDYYFDIIAPGITQAASAVITLGTHPFQVNDEVIITDVLGMTEINDIVCTVTSITPTTITVNKDTQDFTAWSSGGHVSKLIAFSAELNPFNPYRDQGLQCYIQNIDFLIDTRGGFLRVDLYQDEEETPWKENVLLQPTSETQSREWIRVSVDNEANFHTIKMRQNSANSQVKITSIRIYCRPGALTYA